MHTKFVSVGLPAAVALALGVALPVAAQQTLSTYGGDLIVSAGSFVDPGFATGTALPISTGVAATASSAFCSSATCSSNVWNNDLADANFGITGNILLQNVNISTGAVDNSVNVTQFAAAGGANLVTSFSSKSELAINLTPDGSGVTFMGYDTTTGQLDISNGNTPGITEPGNTDIAAAAYRAIGQVTLANNAVQLTTTNAYNGNNGRAAILTSNGYYTVGNAGNGNGSAATTLAAGVQLVTPGTVATPTTSTNQIGQYGTAAKDNNFRGETVFNNTLYVTKGSGNNGVDTVYQVGATGSLATGTANSAATTTPIAILPGFNTTAAKGDTAGPHPFGIWFANSTTLYVADEGSGLATDFGANATTQAGGLEKYSLVNGSWSLDYELKGSLIGSSYTVNGSGAVCGGLAACSLSTTTDGLRNLSGRVNANGTVTLFAVTSTEGSVLGDSGADPNQIVSITDTLAATAAGQVAGENYNVLDTAALGEVYRGVAIAPVPLPASAWLLLAGLGGFAVAARRQRDVAAPGRRPAFA